MSDVYAGRYVNTWAAMTQEEIVEMFMEKVSKLPEAPGCWLWLGSVNNHGYGTVRIRRRLLLAHRCAYEFFRGEIASGMKVLHSCDTPSCVNPWHLSVGTQRDNIHDAVRRFRSAAKLTPSTVIEARRLRKNGLNCEQIAARLGVSAGCIYRVQSGKTWSHV